MPYNFPLLEYLYLGFILIYFSQHNFDLGQSLIKI